MNYTHLTEDERYQIKEYLDEGMKQVEIALRLSRNPSSVSREIRRNRGERGYRPRQAEQKARERQRNSHQGSQIAPDTWAGVEAQLRLDYSPEQVCETRRVAGLDTPSHERIYQHIYADKAIGGTLHEHLRCRKKRRKRYGSGHNRRGQIRNRRCITERPAIVEQRARVGDWEGDTVIGRQESQAIVTLVERKTRFLVARKVSRRTADQVRDAIIGELTGFDRCITWVVKVSHEARWLA
jgi:IS30 family transposase